jgi:hypothetical protein
MAGPQQQAAEVVGLAQVAHRAAGMPERRSSRRRASRARRPAPRQCATFSSAGHQPGPAEDGEHRRGVGAAARAGTGCDQQRSGRQCAHRRPGQAGRQRAGPPGPECRGHQQRQRSPQRPGAMVGPVGAAQADEGAPQAEGQGLVQEGGGGGDVVGQQRGGRRSGTGQQMLSRRQRPARRGAGAAVATTRRRHGAPLGTRS